MADKKLETAQELIKDGHYQAARGLLETMPDDPTARRWLDQLRQYDRANEPAAPPAAVPVRVVREPSNAWKWIVGVIVVLLLVGGVAFAVYNQRQHDERVGAGVACLYSGAPQSEARQRCVDDLLAK